MAKLKLGSAPKNFKRIISIPLVDGSNAEVEMSFIYRTRTKFGELLDGLAEKGEVEEVKTAKDAFKRGNESDADFILKIADGWDLEDAFNKTNVAKMIEEFPAAATIISEAYKVAILEGRVKN